MTFRKVTIPIILISMVSIVGHFLFVKYYNKPMEVVDLQQFKQEILNEHDMLSKESKWVLDMAQHNQEAAYIAQQREEVIEKYQDAKNAISYLFASALMDDYHFFMSAFEYEQFGRDLYKVDNPDKIQVVEGIMERITRGGQLSKLGFVRSRPTTELKAEIHDIVLYYEDGIEVRMTLNVKMIPSSSHHENSEVFYVTTSVWDIIETIEDREVKKAVGGCQQPFNPP